MGRAAHARACGGTPRPIEWHLPSRGGFDSAHETTKSETSVPANIAKQAASAAIPWNRERSFALLVMPTTTESTDASVDPGFRQAPSKSVKIALPDERRPSGDKAHAPPVHDAQSSSFDDEVAWPINRCCYEELKTTELAAIEQLFTNRDDAPMLMKWIILHRSHHTFSKRLLVISPLRLWLLKRSASPFKSTLVVSREIQLLRLESIKVLCSRTPTSSDLAMVPTSIVLLINQDQSGDDKPHDRLHLDPGVHAETIVRLLQRILHAMRLAFVGQRLPSLLLPPQCPWQEFFSTSNVLNSTIGIPKRHSGTTRWSQELGEAMTTAYRCFCDDLGVPYRASVTARLEECLHTSCVDFQYCLSTTTEELGGGRTELAPPSFRSGLIDFLGRLVGMSMQWKEVEALARTLEHCHCFQDIVVYDFPIGDAGLSALFQSLLSPSCAIKGFSLTNVRLTSRALQMLQHVVLQTTIRSTDQRPLQQLRRLNFSFNRFSVMMAHGLATVLELLPSGLEILHLEQCHLSMLGSARILHAMKSSHGFSSCLRELNLSGNTLSWEGTKVLALWITGAFALQRLDLSRTKLKTNVFFQAFKQNSILHESSLVALDLSYNRLGTQASVDLGAILRRSQSLAVLVLRGMRQPRLHPRRLALDLSSRNHRSGPRSYHTQPPIARGLRKVHLQNILEPMFQNMTRGHPCMIDLSENNLEGPKATLLAQLIDNSPNTSRALLRLDHAQLNDRAAVLLLHSLRSCKTLDSLSLEGNGFVVRDTKASYRRFHDRTSAPRRLVHATTALEKAAGDALALLLGGKTSQLRDDGDPATGNNGSNSDGSSHSFTFLYQHKPKKLPLKELNLRASGRMVFGPHILTTTIQALTVNTTLQMLDVSGNECGDLLAQALGAMLPLNKSLQVLYWDDNFTTVEGFFQFYEGLLRNQTLSVVQLPINDTRRILEEQKDPPRERLFSVLGKIFKVTERNQTAQTTGNGGNSRERAKRLPSHLGNPSSASHSGGNDNQLIETPPMAVPAPQEGANAKPQATNPELSLPPATETVVDATGVADGAGNSWGAAVYANSFGSRYPTTLRGWPQDGGGRVDPRASWDQMQSLSSLLT